MSAQPSSPHPRRCTTARRVQPERAPEWLVPLVRAAESVDASALSHNAAPPPSRATRRAAVLVLFGHTAAHGPDLLLQQRAGGLRDHAGQVAFPGGGWEAADNGPVDTALREAAEETGLDPAGVVPLAVLPELYVPPSGFRVTPVLAHWPEPVAVAPVDPDETAAVVRVPVAELADPGNRLLVRHPSGWVGPAFEVAGMVVWGFTGGLVAALLRMGGWERPWTPGPPREPARAWEAARERWEVDR
jgi:8-oxo-dGTP pyrophosphatase MutT (NUDIX family)